MLVEKYKDMCERHNFEQNYYSRTSTSVHKFGHDNIGPMNLLLYYDRSYFEIMNY